jgi:hypothetical protein
VRKVVTGDWGQGIDQEGQWHWVEGRKPSQNIKEIVWYNLLTDDYTLTGRRRNNQWFHNL